MSIFFKQALKLIDFVLKFYTLIIINLFSEGETIMVTLNLKEIFKSMKTFKGSYSFEPQDIKIPADIGNIKNPVFVNIEIKKSKLGYTLSIDMEGEIELLCSRCLTPYNKDISQKKDVRLERFTGNFHGELTSEDLDVSFIEDEENFILDEIIREQIILSVPIKPLCRHDCIGIAEFIFQEEKSKKINPKFAILKNLLEDGGKG